MFYTTIDYHAIDLLFFLYAGYWAHWQKADNYHILMVIQSRISSLKKLQNDSAAMWRNLSLHGYWYKYHQKGKSAVSRQNTDLLWKTA